MLGKQLGRVCMCSTNKEHNKGSTSNRVSTRIYFEHKTLLLILMTNMYPWNEEKYDIDTTIHLVLVINKYSYQPAFVLVW